MSRNFSGKQRNSLFLSASGRCSRCNRPLDWKWEADHFVPWSAGGPTQIQNGQALCRKYNREKGDSIFVLRPFQERLAQKFIIRSSILQDLRKCGFEPSIQQ